MKKTLPLVLALFLILAGVGILSAKVSDDYKVIKNAVKAETAAEKSADSKVSWFKILVTDTKSGKVKVKITIPISLAEMVADCSGNHFKVHEGCDIDLKKILAELKKNGPLSLVEVEDEQGGESVKIWIE